MGYIVKHKFYCNEAEKAYDIGDGYITVDREKAIRLSNLGLIEHSDVDSYDVKVIKTRGKVNARQRPDTTVDNSN